MADQIGIARRWHQGDHYDIPLGKRELALRLGAIPITWRQAGLMTLYRRRTGALPAPADAEEWHQRTMTESRARRGETIRSKEPPTAQRARPMNVRTEREFVEDDAVNVTRPGPWGNPFIIGVDGDRQAVIAKYKARLWDRIRNGEVSLESLASLHGKQLLCVCVPLPCHADVLADAAAWAVQEIARQSTPT